MTATRARNERRSTHNGCWWAGVLLLMSASSVNVYADEPIPAVFKAREISFQFRSRTASFPCHELPGRVAMILRAVGARDDLRVETNGCDQSFIPSERDDPTLDPWDSPRSSADPFMNRRTQPRQSVLVRVRLMMPVQLTPEIRAEIEKDKSRRELVSRVTGDRAAALNDPIVFAAQRQSVTLSRNSIRLDPQDCELLDQMASSIFRELNVRVLRKSYNCNGASRLSPQMTVEALMPVGVQQPPPTPKQPQIDVDVK